MSIFKNCKNTEVIIHWWWWWKRTERSDQLIVKRRISLIVWGPTVNVGKNWLPENALLLIDEITEKNLLLIGWLYEERLIVPISKRWNDVLLIFFGFWIYFWNFAALDCLLVAEPHRVRHCRRFLPVLAGGLGKGTVPFWLR